MSAFISRSCSASGTSIVTPLTSWATQRTTARSVFHASTLIMTIDDPCLTTKSPSSTFLNAGLLPSVFSIIWQLVFAAAFIRNLVARMGYTDHRHARLRALLPSECRSPRLLLEVRQTPGRRHAAARAGGPGARANGGALADGRAVADDARAAP